MEKNLNDFIALLSRLLDSVDYDWQSVAKDIVIPSGPFPGNYDINKTPWFAEVFKKLDDPELFCISLMIPAQTGKTQFLICVALCWAIKNKLPVYFYVPTRTEAQEYFNNKIRPIVEKTKFLYDALMVDRSGKESKSTYKGSSVRFANGGSLNVIGSRGNLAFQGKSSSLIILDELDAMLANATYKQASILDNAKQRLSSFAGKNRKLLISSTPTFEDRGISVVRQESQQYNFHCVCPLCSASFAPDFSQLFAKDFAETHKIDQDERKLQLGRITPRSEFYLKCPSCEKKIPEYYKQRLAEEGTYKETINPNGAYNYQSYHVGGLLGFRSWGEIYTTWLKADDVHRRRNFKNEVLGLPYSTNIKQLLKISDIKKSEYIRGHVDSGWTIVTGWDIQTEQKIAYGAAIGIKNETEMVLIDWFREKFQNYSNLTEIIKLRHGKIYGTTKNKLTLIDSGKDTQQIYSLCSEIDFHNIIPIKGIDSGSDRRGTATPEKNSPLLINRFASNVQLEDYLREGKMLFPKDFSDMEFFSHVSNGVLTLVRGKEVYKKANENKPNDYRDALRYALSGAKYENVWKVNGKIMLSDVW